MSQQPNTQKPKHQMMHLPLGQKVVPCGCIWAEGKKEAQKGPFYSIHFGAFFSL